MHHATVSIRHWVMSPPGWRFAARLRAVRYGGLAMLCAAVLCAETRAAQRDEDSNRDLTQLDLEQLMSLDVETASRFPQKRSEAPAAVTVVSSADIKAYGYRTLADILASIRGLYVRTDTMYTYLGV